jgi:hypothetical protein
LRHDAPVREREDEGVTLETIFSKEEARRGKRRRVMTLTLGAQATTMARWFSSTEKIMAWANHPVEVSSCSGTRT